MSQLKVLASMKSLRVYLLADPATRGRQQGRVQEALSSYGNAASDVDSIALADPSGTFIASSNAADLGQNVKQRDYFTEAMQGRSFISGVSISTITDAPSIFHSTPVRAEDGTVLGVPRSRSKLDLVQADAEAAVPGEAHAA